jgi:hypothetical protein
MQFRDIGRSCTCDPGGAGGAGDVAAGPSGNRAIIKATEQCVKPDASGMRRDLLTELHIVSTQAALLSARLSAKASRRCHNKAKAKSTTEAQNVDALRELTKEQLDCISAGKVQHNDIRVVKLVDSTSPLH